MEEFKKFLETYREEILELSKKKTKHLAGTLGTSDHLKQGVPRFYEQLILILKNKRSEKPSEEMLATAARHGKEFLRLGYSISHVVHSYGAVCQAITEAADSKNVSISPDGFNILNSSLDVAISAAVSEFQFQSKSSHEEREVERIGFLVHELRSAVSAASIAHDMIKTGLVGARGSTSSALGANLIRIRNLIDRSLAEVRMRSDADFMIEDFRLFDLFNQILATAQIEATKKNQSLEADVDHNIELRADRQLIVSIIANLIQNAIKYTKENGKISITAKTDHDMVSIEIEDECGGIEEENINSLFAPFVQKNSDRAGMGLGLAIVHRAVELSHGTISVENLPSKGCRFILQIPLEFKPDPNSRMAVSGKHSVQPEFQQKT